MEVEEKVYREQIKMHLTTLSEEQLNQMLANAKRWEAQSIPSIPSFRQPLPFTQVHPAAKATPKFMIL